MDRAQQASPSGRSVLVVERDLPYVQSVLGPDASGFHPVSRTGLAEGTVAVPDGDLQSRWQSDGGQRVWRPGVSRNVAMQAAFREPPAPARVHGTTMDFHGEGPAVPSARRLGRREGETQRGEGVLVGVVDTGMRSHPWLEGGYLASPQDFETYDAHGLEHGVRDRAGHGTFITGLILQQAQAAGVWVERALEPVGTGLVSVVATAALVLAERGVDVLNLSLGCFDDEPGAQLVMAELLQTLHRVNPDLVVVAAAGNIQGQDGPQEPAVFWPAALPGVLAVGSAEPVGSAKRQAGEDEQAGADQGGADQGGAEQGGSWRWTPWSNRGPWVDLAAPGTDLLSTYLYDRRAVDDPPEGQRARLLYRGWARWSGTSFSAAIVTGVLAATMQEHGSTAREAAAWLRAGSQSPGLWTQAEDHVPAVPVINPADWGQVLVDDGDEDPGRSAEEQTGALAD